MRYRALWAAVFAASIILFDARSQPVDTTGLPAKASLDGMGGFVWAHNESVENLAVSHPVGLMIRYSPIKWSNFRASRYWSGARFGMALGFVSSGQPKVLGSWMPVMVSFENQTKNRFSVLYRISAGLAYLTKTYQPEANPYNSALGAPVAWSLQGQLLFGYRIGLWQPQFAISLLHISNGAYRLPNAGINIPNLSIGLAYYLPSKSANLQRVINTSTNLNTHRRDRLAQRRLTSLSLGAGVKTVSLPPATLLPSITGSISHWYRYGHRGAWSLTTEATWNQGLLREAESLGFSTKTPFLLGALAGHEWLFNRVSLATPAWLFATPALPNGYAPFLPALWSSLWNRQPSGPLFYVPLPLWPRRLC